MSDLEHYCSDGSEKRSIIRVQDSAIYDVFWSRLLLLLNFRQESLNSKRHFLLNDFSQVDSLV